ncbi:MAG TPA: hypothetical protein VMY06_03930 [Sedimentisphaerales bacterium]|nr:hypothetical protein [Sedimentisphaerales bacterium]
MSVVQHYPSNPIDWPGSPHDYSGDNLLKHAAQETTQRYIPGTRYTTWDGRVYKYSYAIAAILGGRGGQNASNVINISEEGTVAHVVGDQFSSITLGASDGYAVNGEVAENELIGGFFLCHNPSVQVRGIISNTGGDAVAIKVYLDAPITSADATPFCEVLLNPYKYLTSNLNPGREYQSTMCVANNNVTASNYFWGQTWGPCFCNPGGDSGSLGDSVNERSVYFVADGSINGAVAITGDSTGHQHAGFIIDETAAANDAVPFVMLQISI